MRCPGFTPLKMFQLVSALLEPEGGAQNRETLLHIGCWLFLGALFQDVRFNSIMIWPLPPPTPLTFDNVNELTKNILTPPTQPSFDPKKETTTGAKKNSDCSCSPL